MSDGKPIFIVLAVGAAITAIVVFALERPIGSRAVAASGERTSANSPPPGSSAIVPAVPAVPAPAPVDQAPSPIKRPPRASAEFGILTDRPMSELEALTDPKSAALLLKSNDCGDAATCDAVRTFLLGEERVQIVIVAGKNWNRPAPSDMDRIAPTLTEKEREAALAAPFVVRVQVTGVALPDQLPARGGFALAAAIAEKLHGFVHDQVTDRLERAQTFAARAITAPLGASAFRKDRIDYQYESNDAGGVRLITAGLTRFGAPDLEIDGAPHSVAAQLADVLGALAEALVNGVTTTPVSITPGDVARARGANAGELAADTPPVPVPIGLADVIPHSGDPNDFMARVVPPEGASPEGYEDLAGIFFGGESEGPPGDDLRAAHEKTQRVLPDLLSRFKASRAEGAALYVEVPFALPGTDAGVDPLVNEKSFDFLLLEVTQWDDRTITGTLVDDSAPVLGLKKGATVTRKRNELTDYEFKLADGGMEIGSAP